MKILKHSGVLVEFDARKLHNSLMKSGADESIVRDILQQIEAQIYDGMSTKQIYKTAFGLLKKTAHSHAARYNLRQAIEQLGPAGFFFEKFIARLFSSEGYQTQTNLILPGKCVSHEVDVVINKNEELSMIECKFHAQRDSVTDVKVPMYILSRFNDLKNQEHLLFDALCQIHHCWIVTNNRFSSDALIFGRCSGLNLLSWDYPENQNLRDKIDADHLYPITCLTTLTLNEKNQLMELNIILVKELLHQTSALDNIHLSPNRIKNILKEARELCQQQL
jgi:hypothetical protein